MHVQEDGWVICRVFKKKILFKIVNEGGSSSSASDQLNNINPSTNNNNNNQPRLLSNNPHQYLLNHQHQNFDLGLNYSHIPVSLPQYPQNIQPQNFMIPTHKQTMGYDDFTTLHSDHQAPLLVKQLMTNPREQTGLEIDTCEPSSQTMGREGGLNEWGMIDRLDQDPNASSMQQLNQLSLRGEMDFWGYGK